MFIETNVEKPLNFRMNLFARNKVLLFDPNFGM